MNKHMYCPIAFAAACLMTNGEPIAGLECTHECAWAVFDYKNDEYCCSVASMALNHGTYHANWRPLKDDAE